MSHLICASLLITVCVLVVSNSATASLDSALHHYETLHHDNFRHHIKKRDLYTRDPEERRLEFDTFGRHFSLVLHRASAVVSDDLKVIAIDEHNVERVVNIKPAIYHGYLADEPDASVVSAYWEDENTLSAAIRTPTDVYAIEPSWRHLPNSSEYSMISYRGSDLKMTEDLGKRFCGFVREGPDSNNHTESADEFEEDDLTDHIEGLRVKRAASSCTPSKSQPVCRLLLTADYRFYRGVGSSSLQTTTSYLIALIDRINAIYVGTAFGSCGTGFGFEIREIRILTSPTSPADAGQYGNFNMEKDNWDTNDLLESFSRDSHYKDFCLSHLFTYISFDNGVLGLAYIAGSKSYSVGGICSPSYYKGGFQLYLNTGWSSSLSRGNRPLLTLEATLVTTHEFGHNWGSEHDPDTSECSPSTSGGGKYIMYTYSVSGMDKNNKIFSPCTQRSIGAVLEAKAGSCFSQRAGGFCGNSKIEGDEECDPGSAGEDSCCDKSCHLKSPAVCSDANDICCTNCQYSTSSKVCQNELDTDCTKQSKCSGSSKTCPQPPPKDDGSPCLQGNCAKGNCSSLCEYNGKYSCICDGVDNACKWCCRNTSDANMSACTPFMSRLLPEGMPCLMGYCDAHGVCNKRIATNNLPRLWAIIEHITVNQLVMFMRANIVGTVIVLSLIIWIPVCSIISYMDYRKKQQHKSYNKLTDNAYLANPADVKIIPMGTRKSTTRRSEDKKPLLR